MLIAIFKLESDKDEVVPKFTCSSVLFRKMDAICGDGTDTVADHLCGRSAIVRSPVQVTCGIYFRRIVHFLCICEYYLCAFYYIQTHWKGSQCNSGHHSDSGFCRNLSDRDDTGVFQKLHPLLPFTYGINAMREAVAGIYGFHYAENLLCLAVYVPIALLIGVVVRPWLLNLNHMFDQKLGETELMICEEEV